LKAIPKIYGKNITDQLISSS